MSFYASGGAVLSLPCAGDFSNSDWHHVIWQADGAGSVLALPGLTSLSYAGGYGGVSVEALSGGQILLTNLAVVGGGNMSAWADGADSLVNLATLQQCLASLSVEASNGGTIWMPQLVDGPGVGLTLRPDGTVSYSQFAHLGTLTVSNLAVVLPYLTNLTGGSLSVQGASVSLPSLSGLASGTVSVVGSNSVLTAC